MFFAIRMTLSVLGVYSSSTILLLQLDLLVRQPKALKARDSAVEKNKMEQKREEKSSLEKKERKKDREIKE